MIDIAKEKFGVLAICAVRYCHGRQTYMPDMVRKIVLPYLDKLTDHDIRVMYEDCDFQRRMRLYGDERIDMPGWLQWEQVLKAEAQKRGMI